MNEVPISPKAALADAQSQPAMLRAGSGDALGLVKIDCAVRLGHLTLVAGWTTVAEIEVHLSDGADRYEGSLFRFDRPDVRKSLGIDEDALGFALVGEIDCAPTLMDVKAGGAELVTALVFLDAVPGDATGLVGKAAAMSLTGVAVGSPEWAARLALVPERGDARVALTGSIDTALAAPGCGGVVSGWVAHGGDCQVWLEDNRGRAADLARAHRVARSDVRDHGPAAARAAARPGFLIHMPALGGASAVRLCGCDPEGRFALPWTEVEEVPREGRAAAERLASIPTRRVELTARCRAVDLPFLERVRRAERDLWTGAPLRKAVLGPVPESPRLSVIVPLYGRFDLIEHQLLEFARDAAFRTTAELIYVIDDPAIEDGVAAIAPRWHEICGPAFRWVSAGQNRGFSGANNLGAAEARGEILIFANSDLIPQSPGWATALADALDADPDIGLVAPRLLFPEGGLQHAGMAPRWRGALGLWTNHHPMMGFDPSLDPAKGPTPVDLVTGACVAIRRSDFEALGGWNTDYIVGDFEDSDLCLRVADAGRKVAYLPDVSLIHLERQSVPLSGDTDLRSYITLLNATLFNARWQRQLRALAE